jgi:hypothetical protein
MLKYEVLHDEYKDEDLNDRQKYLLSKVATIETQLGQLMIEKEAFFNLLKQELDKDNG